MDQWQLDHKEVMEQSIDVSEQEIIILLDDLRTPENIAGIFRLANYFSISKIYLLASEELSFSKKFKSIARSNKDSLAYEVVSYAKSIEIIENYKSKRFEIVSLDYTSQSVDISTYQIPPKSIIIVGNERYGIRKEYLTQSDKSVHISAMGSISSLNVQQAVSIAFYVWRNNFNKM